MAAHPLDRISLQQLRYLIAVADARTWARAADELGVTVSALSQGLGELEKRTGLALFERAGRQRKLRADAGPVLVFARKVLAQRSDFERELQRRVTGAAGELRLGMVDSAALIVLPRALEEFAAQFPEVGLRVKVGVSDDLCSALERAELDLAVVVANAAAARPALATHGLVNEAFAVYRPTSRSDQRPTAADWVGYPSGSRTRSLIDQAWQRRWGHEPRVVAESVNPDVLARLVQLGIGWGVLPRVTGDALGLSAWSQRPLLKRPLVAAWRDDAEWDPRREAFLALAAKLAVAGPGGSRSPALTRS